MVINAPAAIETLAPEDGGYVFRDESILGTRLQLVLVAHSHALAQSVALAVRAEIDRLNLIFNDRLANSEISVLNRATTHRASAELFAVVEAAERWRTLTSGAFSGRLGNVLALWKDAGSQPPEREHLTELAEAADAAHVTLDVAGSSIVRPSAVRFALDGIAKGWIVDRALAVAMSSRGIDGALVDIGGDVRCCGRAPGPEGWRVGINDPLMPFDNAPLVATATLINEAIATSGRGPRDFNVDGRLVSPTISPFTGWPIDHRSSATVISSSAVDADALATAALVLPPAEAIRLADAQQAAVRITRTEQGRTRIAQSTLAPARLAAVGRPTPEPVNPVSWKADWQALATFTAPRRQLIRDPEFRSPYMAMWITKPDNTPVRTLLLVGKRSDWQKDNFIWWSINRERTDKLVSTRSMSTTGAGVYNVFWDGVDDHGRTVDAGTYVLHVETSREKGKHTYRSLTLDFTAASRFINVLPSTEEGGGLRVSFDHY